MDYIEIVQSEELNGGGFAFGVFVELLELEPRRGASVYASSGLSARTRTVLMWTT